MKIDYHMHFERGSYDFGWVQGFFDAAERRGLDEIGISEHSHGFTDFEHFYYDDLILDDSFIGSFQKKWLKKNKFKCPLDDYFTFMDELKKRGKPVKTGIEADGKVQILEGVDAGDQVVVAGISQLSDGTPVNVL